MNWRIVQAWMAMAMAMAMSLCLATSSAAAERKSVLPEAARTSPGGRAVEVTVAQAELGMNINPSIMTLAMGGGVLGVLIDAKVDSDRTKRTQANITPLRSALIDFDADQLAIDATQSAVSAAPWFASGAPLFARDASYGAKSDVLDASSSDQVAFLDYVYDLSPDLSSIRVGVTISIASKAAAAGKKPEVRLYPRNLLYSQTVTSAVQLAKPGDAPDNASQWAAQNGALAKRALEIAFKQAAVLVPRALTLTEDDLTRMGQGEKKTTGGYTGRVQEDGPTGTLLYNGSLIHVQTLQE